MYVIQNLNCYCLLTGIKQVKPIETYAAEMTYFC